MSSTPAGSLRERGGVVRRDVMERPRTAGGGGGNGKKQRHATRAP